MAKKDGPKAALGISVTMSEPEHESNKSASVAFTVSGSFNPGAADVRAQVFDDAACSAGHEVTNELQKNQISTTPRSFFFMSSIWTWNPAPASGQDRWVRVKVSDGGQNADHIVKIHFVSFVEGVPEALRAMQEALEALQRTLKGKV